ncbi:chorismate-binding protein [Conexibacter stalactiti]|uniref:Chorismate-binding protein n=1 Tax=Conexibacter stalactiti TaxID=1940611 RepID=A0ABU4HK67_9ACTN|nr:chorismate-binding protein [Conexibacter stalactiti]MDW5593718.1 chorismate-binding protein [Conexibacter stalactiti]MEC5034359.1 chorismate-binding protein [Conexibacter stalactiti]
MTAVRLMRVALSASCSPTAALRALAGEPWPFALTGRWAGGGAIVGCAPLRLAAPDDDPFALLDELPSLAPGAREEAPPEAVGGGWFGWLGYRLGARVEQLSPAPPRPVALPAFQLAYYDHLLRLDAAGRWWFEALATPARERALGARLDRLDGLLETAAAAPAPPANHPAFHIAGDGAAAHLAAVADCRERIAAGELFQANVCLRFEAEWPSGDVVDLYARAQERLAPAYGGVFPAPWGGIASLSPELFLRRRGRQVESAPIKGTIARAEHADERPAAAAARARLLASAKDHAEHVMIVDLMRNDLGRVCEYGSIAAASAPEAQAHPGLWHLVSPVRGTLRAAVGDGELLRATFPPGSVTGAPKVQALHVINALEGTARELYTGAVGYASPFAGLELNVAIRTFEARAGHLWLGAGGGIVADSDPLAELEECHVKARPLIAAIGGTLPAAPARPAPPAAPAALRRPRRRPDPGRGLFETLLARDGVAEHADAHLARLSASARTLYGVALPADLPARVAAVAAATATATETTTTASRLRIVLTAAGEADVLLAPLAARTLPVTLVPFTLPGGLGGHKWLDRELLDQLTVEARQESGDAGATPLLLDGAGAVLEASWANVLAVEGDTLLTPPADGRILPGVTRALLLARAAGEALTAPNGAAVRRAVEQPLSLDRLARADAILLTSAAAGAVPAVLQGASGPERETARLPRRNGAGGPESDPLSRSRD